MRGQEMNLRHLRAFAQVCRRGGISAASDFVHLSQPAITQAIANLEKDLDSQLFNRSSRGMFPTDAGTALLHRVDRAFDLIETGTGQNRRPAKSDYASLITSTQLRALIAVATHGNFSVAARAAGVAQPSLYKSAKDLEALSRDRFFVKTHKGIDLTPSAERLLRAGRLAFAEFDHAIDDLALLKGDTRGSLRVGSLPLTRASLLPTALNALAELYPRLQIQVIDSSYREMLHALRHGEIDLMLGALRDPAPAPDVVQEPLFEDRLGVFCGPTHPLRGQPPPTWEDLAAYPWVVPVKGAPTRRYFDEVFSDIPAERMGPILDSNSPILIRGLLAGSERLTMISVAQMAEEVRLGCLFQLAIDLNDRPREIGVTYRDSWSPTKVQEDFLGIFRRSTTDATEQTGRSRPLRFPRKPT